MITLGQMIAALSTTIETTDNLVEKQRAMTAVEEVVARIIESGDQLENYFSNKSQAVDTWTALSKAEPPAGEMVVVRQDGNERPCILGHLLIDSGMKGWQVQSGHHQFITPAYDDDEWKIV